jgi:hypothetical protein
MPFLPKRPRRTIPVSTIDGRTDAYRGVIIGPNSILALTLLPVYVQCIPKQYKSNARLLNHFRELFPAKSLVESNIGLQITRLSKRVLERNTVLGKLEHAINVKNVEGTDPTHSAKMCGAKVDSIPTYIEELHALNKKVKASIERLELLDDGMHPTKDTELGTGQEQPREADELLPEKEKVMKAINAGRADGAHLNAAFVSFNSLRSRNAALQIEQYDVPFEMEVFEAPDPEGRSDLSKETVSFRHGVDVHYRALTFLVGFVSYRCLLGKCGQDPRSIAAWKGI